MIASFLGTNAFAVTGDRTAEFTPGVRVLADCGADGARYGTVAAALYAADADRTTVTLALDTDGLTAALTAVLHGNDIPASLANHGHTGPADGGSVAHDALVGVGANSHAAIDAFLASKAAASGLASLDAASRVVQDPANATVTPGVTKIVMSDAAGTVDAWVSDAATSGKGKVQLATVAETQAGASADKAVTPVGLAGTAKGLIAADTMLHVATTGSDATGDGSWNAPFASISGALASIRNKLIASGVTVTIQAADGTYTVSDTIVVNHPDADKIRILGNTSAETTVAIAAIDVDAKTITVAGDYAASIASGDDVEIRGSSTAGLNGIYTVSDVAYAGENMVITCISETFASSVVGGGSLILLLCNRCILSTNGVHCLNVLSKINAINGFKILSVGGSETRGISAQSDALVQSVGSNVIIKGHTYGLYAGGRGYFNVFGSKFKSCGVAMIALASSKVILQAGPVIIDGCNSIANAYNDSFINLPISSHVSRNCVFDYYPTKNTSGNNNSYIAVS